jgi:hypothetical protein
MSRSAEALALVQLLLPGPPRASLVAQDDSTSKYSALPFPALLSSNYPPGYKRPRMSYMNLRPRRDSNPRPPLLPAALYRLTRNEPEVNHLDACSYR